MSVDPITGLPNGEDAPQETAHIPFRPQSPLVRGSHLDKSRDRLNTRSRFSEQHDTDNVQLSAKCGELQGLVPPVYGVFHPRDKLVHITDVIQCVIEGKEELVSEDELLLTHPPNLEKTRFSMSKKKLKLGFIDDVLDRFEEEGWLYPEQIERKRKIWHKSVARSIKFIGKFLDKEPSCGSYVRPQYPDESFGNTTIVSGSTSTSTRKGRKQKSRSITESSVAPKKRGRKSKANTEESGLATLSKLTLPASTEKIPKKTKCPEKDNPPASMNKSSKKPKFGNKTKIDNKTDVTERPMHDNEKKKAMKKKVSEREDCEASSPKKSRKEKTNGEGMNNNMNAKKGAASVKAKKPAFGAPKKGKRGAKSGEDKVVREETTCATSATGSGDVGDIEKKVPVLIEQSDHQIIATKMEKRFDVYENMEEVEEPIGMEEQNIASQSATVLVVPVSIDEEMETDDEDWEPNNEPRELTPPRVFTMSQDDSMLPPAPSSFPSHSSQSLFGSYSSSLMGSANNSFSSQSSSSLVAPSMVSSFNLSSVLIPSQPLATSTQIPMSQPLLKEEDNEKSVQKPTSSGTRVRPTFGKRK